MQRRVFHRHRSSLLNVVQDTVRAVVSCLYGLRSDRLRISWHCTHSGCEAWPAAPVHAAVRARVKIQCRCGTRLASPWQYVANKRLLTLCLEAWAEWAGRRDARRERLVSDRGNGIAGTPHHPSYPSRLDFFVPALSTGVLGNHDVPGRIIHCVPRDVASDASAQRSQHRCILQVIWRSIRSISQVSCRVSEAKF